VTDPPEVPIPLVVDMHVYKSYVWLNSWINLNQCHGWCPVVLRRERERQKERERKKKCVCEKYVWVYVCTYVCVYRCICAFMFLCACVRLCWFVCIFVCLCISLRVCMEGDERRGARERERKTGNSCCSHMCMCVCVCTVCVRKSPMTIRLFCKGDLLFWLLSTVMVTLTVH